MTDTDRSSRLCPFFSYFLAMQGNVFQMPQANMFGLHTPWWLNTHGEMQPPTKGLPEGYVPHDLRWTQWFSFTSVALGHFKRKHKTLTKPLQTFQQYSWKYKTFKKPQQKNVKASSEAVLCSSYKRLSRTRKKGKAAPGPGAHPCATNSATYLSLTHLQNTEEPSAVWQ